MRSVPGLVLLMACVSCGSAPAPIHEQQIVVPATQMLQLLNHGDVARQLVANARSAAGEHGALVKQELAEVGKAYEDVRRSFNNSLTTIGLSLVGNVGVPTLEKQMGELLLTLPPLVGALESKCEAAQKKIESQLKAVADDLDGMKKSIALFNEETARMIEAETRAILQAETSGRKPPVRQVSETRHAEYAELVQRRVFRLSADPDALDSAIAALRAGAPQDPIGAAIRGTIVGLTDAYIHWQQAALEARKGLASDMVKSLKTLELLAFADLK